MVYDCPSSLVTSLQLSIPWIHTKAINPDHEEATVHPKPRWGKKFDAEACEVCGPNIPETFKHTATPGRANWSELLGRQPTSVSCLQTHISESRETETGIVHIDKGKSKEGKVAMQEDPTSSCISSEMGVGRGHQLYSLLCFSRKRGYMHLALMNCHEHLAQNSFSACVSISVSRTTFETSLLASLPSTPPLDALFSRSPFSNAMMRNETSPSFVLDLYLTR